MLMSASGDFRTVGPQVALMRSFRVRLPAWKVQSVNEFLLGSTYRISFMHSGPQAHVQVVSAEKSGEQKNHCYFEAASSCGPSGRNEIWWSPAVLSAPPINSMTRQLIELTPNPTSCGSPIFSTRAGKIYLWIHQFVRGCRPRFSLRL